MNDYPTHLRVIAAFKAGEDLAVRLQSAVKSQNAMADALKNAADYIERLEALRVEDGKQMSVLIAECQEMKDRLVDGDDVKISCKKTDDDTQPVAWANFYPDEEFVDFDKGCVERCSDEGEVVPLYRVPQSCPHVRGTVTQHCSLNFTLTDAEREAIEWCLSLPMLDRDVVRMIPLRSLLERLK